MRARIWFSLLAVALVYGYNASTLHAQSSWTEEFTEEADDNYEPETRDQVSEVDDGVPPYELAPASKWRDLRGSFYGGSTFAGVIEENMSTVGDDATYPLADPGATTPEFAVVGWEGGTGPYWTPNSSDGNFTSVCYSMDIWGDPTIGAGPGGQPDLPWWHSEVNFASTYTGSGFTVDVLPSGLWAFTTTAGNPVATVAPGSWYEMEVCFEPGGDGNIQIRHTLYDATGTTPLGSYIIGGGSVYLGPIPNQLMDVSYSWFGNGTGTAVFDAAFVDDFHVEGTPVPEPSTIVLLGMGVLGMGAVYRRRRSA